MSYYDDEENADELGKYSLSPPLYSALSDEEEVPEILVEKQQQQEGPSTTREYEPAEERNEPAEERRRNDSAEEERRREPVEEGRKSEPAEEEKKNEPTEEETKNEPSERETVSGEQSSSTQPKDSRGNPPHPWAGHEKPVPNYPWGWLAACDRWFQISDRGSSFGREMIGGLTTFLSMVYILGLNPSILTSGGKAQLWDSIFIATCLASFISTLVMALVPNVPFALSCGLGLNAQIMLYTIGVMGPIYTYGGAMTIVFVEGIIFLVITLLGFREYIFEAIPRCIKSAISVGIGLFIAFIGMQNAGMAVDSPATLVSLVSIHEMYLDSQIRTVAFNALVCFIGIFAICILDHYQIKGCVFFGIIIAALIGIAFGVTPVENITKGWNIGERFRNFFTFDEEKGATFGLCFPGFKDAFSPGTKVPTTIVLIISYGMVDLFDTLGTVYGLGLQSNLLDKETGKCYNFTRVLFADCVGAVFGAIFGTSSVTTYVESSTGIAVGARTGFAALTTAVLFLLSIFVSPIFNMLPLCATSPALIYVGVQMMATVVYIDFTNIIDSIPIFMTIIMMPVTYSITNGMCVGVVTYTVVHLVRFLFDCIVYCCTGSVPSNEEEENAAAARGEKTEISRVPKWPINIGLGIITVLFALTLFLPTEFTKPEPAAPDDPASSVARGVIEMVKKILF